MDVSHPIVMGLLVVLLVTLLAGFILLLLGGPPPEPDSPDIATDAAGCSKCECTKATCCTPDEPAPTMIADACDPTALKTARLPVKGMPVERRGVSCKKT